MNTNIDIKTVLEKWAEFSEWDPDQRKFNLMSYNYFFHKNNEIVFEFYKKYPQLVISTFLSSIWSAVTPYVGIYLSALII